MATPRIRHLRYLREKRYRYSGNLLDWLAAQATRLSTTVAAIVDRMRNGESSFQVEAVTGTYPTNTVLPTITGTPTVGETLTGANGTWTGTATITYARQWLRSGAPITGATGATYDVVEADVGAVISFRVTAANALGATSATSAATAIVEEGE